MSEQETPPHPPEVFTPSQQLDAIKLFLDYGAKTRIPESRPRCDSKLGHRGYFSGNGWAARSLRSLRDHLKKPPVERIIEEMCALTDEQRTAITSQFCGACGSRNTSCNCWNDE